MTDYSGTPKADAVASEPGETPIVREELRHLREIEGILREKLDSAEQELDVIRERFEKTQEEKKNSYYDMDTRERLALDRVLQEIDAQHAVSARAAMRLQKLSDSPYFSRIDFAENDVFPALPFYIGRFNFLDNEEILIFDWRAPVSSMFYDHDTGPAWYEAPDGRISGTMSLKRQFRIRSGHLDYVTDTSQTVSDDILQEELSHTSDERMKTIIATIQREQNVVIRNEKAKVMIIQGAAGSGKTSIALHRIAFLLYRFSGKIRAEDVMILSPSKAFSDYISDVIPELGEEPVKEYSFYELAMDALDDVIDFDDPGDPLDASDEGWKSRAAFKSSADFLKLLQEYVRVLPERAFSARDYRYDEAEVDADWIMQQYLFYQYDPVLQRLPTITDEVLEEFRYRGGLHRSREKRGTVYNKLKAMLKIRTPQALYRDFYQWLGLPEMLRMQKNRLEWPDVFPFLFLWHAYHGLDRHRNIRHLVVDEMQDYTPVQYAVLNIMYPCNKTILGDYGQCLNPLNRGTLQDLRSLYPEAQFVELRKSYRSTAEIMRFALKISPDVRLEVIDRHGKEPEVAKCADEAAETALIAGKIREFRESGYASLAVILRSGRAAAEYYEKLRKVLPEQEELTLLSSSSREFRNGILVTSVQMAKGLEFDSVIVPRTDRDYDLSGFDRNLLYIACTRAMHELTLTEGSTE